MKEIIIKVVEYTPAIILAVSIGYSLVKSKTIDIGVKNDVIEVTIKIERDKNEKNGKRGTELLYFCTHRRIEN